MLIINNSTMHWKGMKKNTMLQYKAIFRRK